MKNVLRKSSIIIVFLLLCALLLVAVLSSNTSIASAEEQTRRVNLAIEEASVEDLAYSPLETTNYVETNYCRILQPETDKYPGVVGNNAIRKTPSSTSKGVYQLYFDNLIESGKTYEVSFWVKANSSDSAFYINVYYVGEKTSSEFKDLPKIKSTEGEWVEYSFLIKGEKKYSKILKLILDPKNGYDEIFYDQVSLSVVDEVNTYISGANFSDEDWAKLPEMTPASFINGGIDIARSVKNGTLTSNILEVPQSGMFRLALAVERTSDVTVKLQIHDIIGTLIDERVLSDTSLLSTYNVTTSDLSEYKFVMITLIVESTTDDGYAKLGLIEVIEHTHDFFGQKESLLSDCQSQKTCNVCNLAVVMGEHDYVVTNPNCSKDGKKVCSVCNDTIVIAKTGQHRYPTCSSENAVGSKSFCLDCGKARKTLQQEHTLVYERLSDTKHRVYCSFCGYEEICDHQIDSLSTLLEPNFEDGGYLMVGCSICEGKVLIEVPKVDEEGSELWTKTVVSDPSCVKVGEIRYDYTLQNISVSVYTEPHGHEYEAIKKDATCTEDGISLHHKCTICNQTKENENEIRVIVATGHVAGDWVQTKDPTLSDDGFRYRNCSICGEKLEEEIIPHLNESDYTKYALENHDTENGYYEYYSSDLYGVYSVWVEGTHINRTIITIVVSCFAAILVVAIAIYITFVILRKKKVGTKK